MRTLIALAGIAIAFAGGSSLARGLQGEPSALVRGAPWQAEIYTEGETWTLRNVLSHFVTSERGLVRLFEKIRLGDAGSPDDWHRS